MQSNLPGSEAVPGGLCRRHIGTRTLPSGRRVLPRDGRGAHSGAPTHIRTPHGSTPPSIAAPCHPPQDVYEGGCAEGVQLAATGYLPDEAGLAVRDTVAARTHRSCTLELAAANARAEQAILSAREAACGKLPHAATVLAATASPPPAWGPHLPVAKAIGNWPGDANVPTSLSVSAGERLRVITKRGDGWWLAAREQIPVADLTSIGLVPASYLEEQATETAATASLDGTLKGLSSPVINI